MAWCGWGWTGALSRAGSSQRGLEEMTPCKAGPRAYWPESYHEGIAGWQERARMSPPGGCGPAAARGPHSEEPTRRSPGDCPLMQAQPRGHISGCTQGWGEQGDQQPSPGHLGSGRRGWLAGGPSRSTSRGGDARGSRCAGAVWEQGKRQSWKEEARVSFPHGFPYFSSRC